MTARRAPAVGPHRHAAGSSVAAEGQQVLSVKKQKAPQGRGGMTWAVQVSDVFLPAAMAPVTWLWQTAFPLISNPACQSYWEGVAEVKKNMTCAGRMGTRSCMICAGDRGFYAEV